ncbi:MAG: helix-turn-helix domain-containing protein [Candidatus Micrarchaeota archaeon]
MQDECRGEGCPVEATLKVVGGKWKTVILFHLDAKTMRFSELRRSIPDVTEKMLAQQLKELEGDGIISRRVYPQVPPKVEYAMTKYGMTLKPVIAAMAEWGQGHRKRKA